MFDNFKDTTIHIKQGIPGRRFIDYYNYRKTRKNESAAKHWGMILLGGLLLIVGTLLGPVPVIPGFILAVPGIAILCSRSKIAAKLLDATERLLRKIRRRKPKPPPSPTSLPTPQNPPKPFSQNLLIGEKISGNKKKPKAVKPHTKRRQEKIQSPKARSPTPPKKI